MDILCRILGHVPIETCIATWGDDDRWECVYCHKDLGPLAIGPWRPAIPDGPLPTWNEIMGETV